MATMRRREGRRRPRQTPRAAGSDFFGFAHTRQPRLFATHTHTLSKKRGRVWIGAVRAGSGS